MDDAVNVAFDDEDDAAKWIERVCNLFISQRLTVLFRGMEATLKDGGFDEWLQQDEEYNDQYFALIEAKAEKKQTLQKWEELNFKREWLGFYKFFDAVQLKLKIKPFHEDNSLEVIIEAKNRENTSLNHLMLLSTQVHKHAS